MGSFPETQGQPLFIPRIRRLSKSGYLYESNSKSPRLDKMIAHISLFDRTTKCLEEDLAQEREETLAQKRIGNQSGRPARPKLAPRAQEYEHTSQVKQEDMPAWVTELTSKHAKQERIYVTEVEQVEDVDEEDEDWRSQICF